MENIQPLDRDAIAKGRKYCFGSLLILQQFN
ncbi:hypothetical protein PB1_12429 [Bacillus methanolicus PB1]|uniref:Uncharacterized protein n=1 Tax=Bacillus methanolicus PB1 TaxID=997296 RepID=I3DVU5_BACMT|nr:hypothetical protein PB1_12429 [Bacillus methanolicus PB1]